MNTAEKLCAICHQPSLDVGDDREVCDDCYRSAYGGTEVWAIEGDEEPTL